MEETLSVPDPPSLLVYAQEYLSEFVDWAGVGFFARDKLPDNGEPVPYPARCDGVVAVIDTRLASATSWNSHRHRFATSAYEYPSLRDGGVRDLFEICLAI
jgi:hypothetical protein